MVKAIAQSFEYILEQEDAFLQLWPHRYDFIYAPHPHPQEKPQWQTENRYPLSDRLLQQGSYLYGVRFGTHTQYCLLDIDVGSTYHPRQDPLAITRIVEALEPLGLVSYVACTSSYSQGLHLYFPFEIAQNSWQLASAVTHLLENQGFCCQPGQLEVFPNSKLYVVDDVPSLFNAHRLPLQAGSYLLNSQLEPICSSQLAFVQQWQSCQSRNITEAKALARVLRQARRSRHHVSRKADQFLNDLNAEIEVGWTGKGQTNYLLGRITMRTYIFHHVIHGGLPLSGESLVAAIVAVATTLPGYRQWCGHQHEIQERATEWARCIENSHYFPYGTSQGKYRAKQELARSNVVEQTWNEQRAQTAQAKIQAAVADLLDLGQLPETATARFQKLVQYGIGGSTLYKYKDLWHPRLWKTPQTPLTAKGGDVAATAAPAATSYPPSLFSQDDRNALSAGALSDLQGSPRPTQVRNEAESRPWQPLVRELEARRGQQKLSARSPVEPPRDRKVDPSQVEKMADYLRSRDPILMKEGLAWWIQQEEVPIEALVPPDISLWPRLHPRLATLMAVGERLVQLGWSPSAVRATLGNRSFVALPEAELEQWLQSLPALATTG